MYIDMEKQITRKKNFNYTGKLENYQIMNENRPTVMEYETDGYNQYQNYLYKRSLYGLDALTKEELETMCSKKKQRIVNVYKKAQVILNKFKQQVTIQYTNFLFEKLFPNSPLTEFFLANTELDDKVKNTLTFKDLNISKDHIVKVFIEEGVLPKNFLSLNEPPINLPRLKNAK